MGNRINTALFCIKNGTICRVYHEMRRLRRKFKTKFNNHLPTVHQVDCIFGCLVQSSYIFFPLLFFFFFFGFLSFILSHICNEVTRQIVLDLFVLYTQTYNAHVFPLSWQNSFDYAMLGASSKFASILLTYPYQVFPLPISKFTCPLHWFSGLELS